MRDRLRAQPEDEPAARRRAAPAPDVLTLLRHAGNRATGRALARARDAARADYAMVVAGLGEVPLQSFHVDDGHTVSVAFAATAAGPELQRAVATGAVLAGVVIRTHGHTITLRDVVVASFQVGDGAGGGPPVASLRLNAQSLEFQ